MVRDGVPPEIVQVLGTACRELGPHLEPDICVTLGYSVMILDTMFRFRQLQRIYGYWLCEAFGFTGRALCCRAASAPQIGRTESADALEGMPCHPPPNRLRRDPTRGSRAVLEVGEQSEGDGWHHI